MYYTNLKKKTVQKLLQFLVNFVTLITNKSSTTWDEWVSDCCLMPNEQFVGYIMVNKVTFQWDNDDVCLVLDHHA